MNTAKKNMIKCLFFFLILIFFSLPCMATQGYKVYILLGYPGSGKGTFAEVLKERGYKHISTGNILREEVKRKTPIGVKYKHEIESSSNLLPEEVINRVVLNKIEHFLKKKEKLILDGFPKTVEQAKFLDELIDKYFLRQNVYVIYIDIPLKLALERIQKRRNCSKCGKIYNLSTAKPKIANTCDTCLAPLIQRTSDTAECFDKRILLFDKTVKKVITYYNSQGNLIKIKSDSSLQDFANKVMALDNL
jgi:adenylate kinase